MPPQREAALMSSRLSSLLAPLWVLDQSRGRLLFTVQSSAGTFLRFGPSWMLERESTLQMTMVARAFITASLLVTVPRRSLWSCSIQAPTRRRATLIVAVC